MLKVLALCVFSMIMVCSLQPQASAVLRRTSLRLNMLHPVNKVFVTSSIRSTGLADEPQSVEKAVYLKQGKARLFQGGNPIIFGGAVKDIRGDPAIADTVLVKDHHGNMIGKGFFNPISQYRVRVMALASEEIFDDSAKDIIESRIQSAISVRCALNLPSEETSAYRLVNGEGDRLGGLIIDVLGDTIVVQSSAYWVEKQRGNIISSLLRKLEASETDIIWRRVEARLLKDGFPVNAQESNGGAGHPATSEHNIGVKSRLLKRLNSVDASKRSEHIVVRENGVRYRLCPATDQKTGFYCDQRENRQLVRALVKEKRVLDAYCYHGGFSINAVLGGARDVTAVDSSLPALSSFEENLKLNDLDGSVELKHGDAVEVMKQLSIENREYDFIICDPPKLAPTRNSLEKAMKKYQRINAAAMALIDKEKGGLLLTCTCSAAMTQSGKFLDVLGNAAKDARRQIALVSQTGAATDHPVLVSYPEGKYLTAMLLHVK